MQSDLEDALTELGVRQAKIDFLQKEILCLKKSFFKMVHLILLS